MDKLDKIIAGLVIALVIVIAIGMLLPSITGSGKHITNSTTSQKAYVSNVIKAMKNSSIPIPINTANTLVFGSGKSASQQICYQQQAYFGPSNPSQLNVLYDGYYVPIYLNVQALGNYAPNLIGNKIYISFTTNNNHNTSATYIVKSENIQGDKVVWNMSFDGSTSNAINSMLNATTGNITISYINGFVLQNETPLISPITNGNFTAPNC